MCVWCSEAIQSRAEDNTQCSWRNAAWIVQCIENAERGRAHSIAELTAIHTHSVFVYFSLQFPFSRRKSLLNLRRTHELLMAICIDKLSFRSRQPHTHTMNSKRSFLFIDTRKSIHFLNVLTWRVDTLTQFGATSLPGETVNARAMHSIWACDPAHAVCSTQVRTHFSIEKVDFNRIEQVFLKWHSIAELRWWATDDIEASRPTNVQLCVNYFSSEVLQFVAETIVLFKCYEDANLMRTTTSRCYVQD